MSCDLEIMSRSEHVSWSLDSTGPWVMNYKMAYHHYPMMWLDSSMLLRHVCGGYNGTVCGINNCWLQWTPKWIKLMINSMAPNVASVSPTALMTHWMALPKNPLLSCLMSFERSILIVCFKNTIVFINKNDINYKICFHF